MTEERRGRTIALCGKGGTGKTSLAALMVMRLAERGDLRILAVDADPAAGLGAALGVSVSRTLDEIRNDLVARFRQGERYAPADLAAELDYSVLAALGEGRRFALLAVGRPEGDGCFCAVNSVLKDAIAALARHFDVVIIDGEAGVEQINRRVMEQVDDLIAVSDTSAKGITVAATIGRLVRDRQVVSCSRMGLVVNRVRHDGEIAGLVPAAPLEVIAWIPEDDLVRQYDFAGRSLGELPVSSPARRAAERLADDLLGAGELLAVAPVQGT
jgi:CO dehydrogenase maturation factor